MKKETKLQELQRRIEKLEKEKSFPTLSLGGKGTAGHVCTSDGLQYLSNPPQWKCAVCGKFYFYPTPAQQVPGMPFSTC